MTYAQLCSPARMTVGGGCSETLGTVARESGLTNVLVVTDLHLVEQGLAERLVGSLESAGIGAAVYDEVQPDPTDGNVLQALAMCKDRSADGVVAIGGGSPIDAAKAVAAMVTNPGGIADYAGYDKFHSKGLPLIAVPTTSGSGSEATRATVITDTTRDVKMAIYDDILMPTAALVDYRLTMTMPRELTAHVGIDSLVHAVEAYVSTQANTVSDMYALEAIRLLGSNLRRTCFEPADEAAREAVMLGATLAGMAFSNASLGLVHGMSRPIGAHFHIPHGLSNAILFPTVTRYSLDAALGRYARIARELGLAEEDHNGAFDRQAVGQLIDELESLNEDLEIPSLADMSVEPDRFEEALTPMAEAALASGSPDFNPRQPTKAEIVSLYRGLY